MKKRVFTRKSVREFVRGLRVAYHEHGRHVGLNVKVYNFPKPIKSILFETLCIAGAREDWWGSVLHDIFYDTEYRVREKLGIDDIKLYSAGRSGGYWGFWVPDLESAGIPVSRAIKALRSALADTLYETFYNVGPTGGDVGLFGIGHDISNSDTVYIDLYAVVNGDGSISVKAALDGMPEWKKIEPRINEILQSEGYESYEKIFKIFRSFVTCSEFWKCA